MRRIFDAHLDLALNALCYDRDQSSSLRDLRTRELGISDRNVPPANETGAQLFWGTPAVSLPEMRRGGVFGCLPTLLMRAGPLQGLRAIPPLFHLDRAAPGIAEAAAVAQYAYYRRLETDGHLVLVRDAAALRRAWDAHGGDEGAPIAGILSMEGCDPIVHPADVPAWWERGLRTACLAHYLQGRYAFGTGGSGPLTPAAGDLLRAFRDVGMILDLVHTAEPGFYEALDRFPGPIFVSHGNCRALVPGDRQLSDEQIRLVFERGGIIGVALDAWMLAPGYLRRKTPRDNITLEAVADHVDHLCQIAGSAAQVGIGSDLDGGFGIEQCPADLDSIADLQKLDPILKARGYSDADVDAVFHANWIRFFSQHLPAATKKRT
jgi:membrane dipeptidase